MNKGPEHLERIRSEAREIFTSCIIPVNPYTAVKHFIHLNGDNLIIGPEEGPIEELDLKKIERISLLGAGKATASMARAIEDLFGKQILSGMINVKYGFTEKLRSAKITEAGHPVPDQNGMAGTEKC